MSAFDERIDAYIEKSADFAKPILTHIRNLIHKAFPEIQETMKWSMPFFDYKGPICNMAAFKQHCSFGFWKSALMRDPQGLLSVNTINAMGQFGRITSVADLPPDEVMIEYILTAVELNEADIKVSPKKPETPRTNIVVPDYFTELLCKHPKALAQFEMSSYSYKKEYAAWILEAKTEETRNKRMATAIEWISEGKGRNWKYETK